MSEMTQEDVITALRHPLNNTCQEAQLRNEQVLAHDAAQRQRIAQLEEQQKVAEHIEGSFWAALKLLNLTELDVQNPGRHFTERITQLEAALKQEQAAHEEDVAQLVKHCACEWEGEEPRRQTVTCGTHRKLEARAAELEALYSDSCSALNAHMEIHAEVVNMVRDLEAEVVRLIQVKRRAQSILSGLS